MADLHDFLAQRPITARMYIGAPAGRLGLRGAAARRSATWPFALVGLRATSHTCDTLYEMPLSMIEALPLFLGSEEIGFPTTDAIN
jgi:hypothetical protein